MNMNLKRDQVPPDQAENWALNMQDELSRSFNLLETPIILHRETYLKLSRENENRLRIYLGLEPKMKADQYVLCAYAVSCFLFGNGDVFRDYENPVIKLTRENVDYSSKVSEAIDNIKRYQQWQKGELDSENKWARFRKFIYPKAFLLSKFELHEIFNIQNRSEAQISFGMAKTMKAMIYPDVKEKRPTDDQSMVFDFSDPCPPICDESSIFYTK